MKKIFFIFLILLCNSIFAQTKYSNILNSINISEIENFLKEAHPDDSRRKVMQRKVVSLKNEKPINTGKTSNVKGQVPVNPTKYYTETTQAKVKEAVILDYEKVSPVPVNPTKYYTEKVLTKTSETVKSNVEKVGLVAVNPTEFSIKIPLIEKVASDKMEDEKELLGAISIKTPVRAVDLIPINPTKYSKESPPSKMAESVKTEVEKALVAFVAVNPTKTPIAKEALVPVNLTNYYSNAKSNLPSNTGSAILNTAQPVVVNRSGVATNLIKPNPINFANTTSSPVNQSSYTIQTGNDEEEFQKLFSETPKSHKDKTVKMLNQLFDNDLAGENAILLIKNNGDCNMIVRIQGKVHYNLAIPARGENFLTVKKGNYELSGNMCEAKYISSKSIAKNMLVTLAKTPGNF